MREFESSQRAFLVEMPPIIYQVEGIRVFGRNLRSFIFSTDVAIIRNTNADAVLAMYPFATQPMIHNAILQTSNLPIFVGVGSTGVSEERLCLHAHEAESAGAEGIVLGPHIPSEHVARVRRVLDIPLVVTVASSKEDIERRIDSGADIVNVSGAQNTASIVEHIKSRYPYVPVIATGGPTDETILETIRAGADAISFTPPSLSEIFSKQMEIFREQL